MKPLALLAPLILLACAPKAQWIKADATQQDFSTDSYSCEKDTRQSGYFGGGLVGAVNMQGFFNKCMEAHGWRLEQVPKATAQIVTTNFTREQWDAGTHQCQTEARAAETGGEGFANTFDRCMRQHGL
jgi:hypothetical protein